MSLWHSFQRLWGSPRLDCQVGELATACEIEVWARVQARIAGMSVNEAAGYIRATAAAMVERHAVGRFSEREREAGLRQATDLLVRRLLKRMLETSPRRRAA